jgi:uncharacterized membrane protein
MMPTLYNKFQGQSLERLAALSDGIFAVALTLLVLDLHTPLTVREPEIQGECAVRKLAKLISRSLNRRRDRTA